MDEEIWKEIPGCEYYEASTWGRIRSVRHYVNTGRYNAPIGRGGRVLKPTLNCHGYHYVSVKVDGKMKKMTVHRLVALTFLENPNNYEDINHKDENRTNNRVDNLEWCTSAYNCNYGTRNEKLRKLSQKYRVYKLDAKTGEVIEKFDTANEAARSVGRTSCSILYNGHGKTKICAGYKWKLEEV